MNSVFSEEILADKLSKLNSTQHCIETLSHWCIFHQKEAELVVETWKKQFHSSQQEQKVSFLYLANDILQNSKRKGTEFVSQFWKVLPAALKDVMEHGDERGKKTVNRLVTIWEERKVFGSRARDLKELMLGEGSPPPLELSKKRSRSVKIVKRDSRSLKIKLSIGGTAEKIVSAFHSVLSEHNLESSELSKCNDAVHRLQKMEKDVASAISQDSDSGRTTLRDEIQGQETILKQCIEKLKPIAETRQILVSQLREALREQESELENVRTLLQVANGQVEEASIMRKRLNNEPIVVSLNTINRAVAPPDPPTQYDSHKKTAAALADKLTASTSSFQMMSSILSSFAAEEAKGAGVATSTNLSNPYSNLEKPLPMSNPPAFMSTMPVPNQAIHRQSPPLLGHQQVALASQPHYQLIPGPSQQYLQPSVAGTTYGYSSLPPPQPPSQQHLMSYSMPVQLPQQPMPQLPMQPMPLNQQQVALTSRQPLPSPGMQFYTYQSHG